MTACIYSSSYDRAEAIAKEFGLGEGDWTHVPIPDKVQGVEYSSVYYEDLSDYDVSDIVSPTKIRGDDA